MSDEEVTRCPIQRWRLRNFKSVEDAEVAFAPLTILVGANSSGKSSLLQSILLVSQAAQGGPSSLLPLNGALVELGEVRNVLFAGKKPEDRKESAGRKPNEFSIGGDFGLDASIRPGYYLSGPERRRSGSTVSWDASFGSMTGGQELGAARLASAKLVLASVAEEEELSFETRGARRKKLEVFPHGGLASAAGEVLPVRGVLKEHARALRRRLGVGAPNHGDGRTDIRQTAGLVQVGGIPIQYYFEVDNVLVKAMAILERLERSLMHRSMPDSKETGRELDEAVIKRIEDELAHAIVVGMEADDLGARRSRDALRDSGELALFFAQLNSLKRKRIVTKVLKTIGKGAKVLVPNERGPGYSFGLERVATALAMFLARNLRYLGPLREDPRIIYLQTPGEQYGRVGKKGEKAVALLHTHGATQVDCFYPDERPPRRCTLAEAVIDWLQFFEIAEGIHTELRPRLGLEPHLKLPDVGRTLDMTAVGVGVSQIFPVLVMGLHSPPGTVLLMEQPELHLHPALQQRLGDFLLACARSGRQLIVETHSDHLISRLRRRIAEDKTNELHRSLAVIFAERHDGRTSYRHVDVNRFGGIEEWPQGFFDQAAKESQLIIRAGLDKKRKEAEAPPAPDQKR